MNALDALQSALRHPLDATDLNELGPVYRGKVRDCYVPGDGRRIIVTTDRISAFDRVLGTLPLKGQLLTHAAAWWFERTAAEVPNHLLSRPDPNVLVCEDCTPLPVEMVVRAYLTGTTSTSIWKHYERGVRSFCGHQLPDGLRKHQKLPHPILTPSTKAADGAHDVSVSRDELLAMTPLSPQDFDQAADMSMRLFAIGQRICLERGLILVDTKYELGRARDGRLMVIDEVHTPDSSRFWYASSYQERFEAGLDPESFDKEYVRRYLANLGFVGDGPVPPLPDDIRIEASRRYLEAVEQVTGGAVPLDLNDPLPRIRRSLGLS